MRHGLPENLWIRYYPELDFSNIAGCELTLIVVLILLSKFYFPPNT